jgi:hypothetical protein
VCPSGPRPRKEAVTMLLRNALAVLVATALLCWSSPGAAATIDFDDLPVGAFVTDQYFASLGVTIAAVNPNRSHDAAITFDSQNGSPPDLDLQGPDWAGGNLAADMTVLGNLLIIAQNIRDEDGDGLVDVPNDEGKGPAGHITFSFATPIVSFGLDLIDIELPDEPGSLAFYAEGILLGDLSFATLALMDPTIVFGDNTANRVAPIAAELFQAEFFDQVVVGLGGSGALDNIRFDFQRVPEPGLALLLGMGLVLALRRGRQSESRR